MITDFPYYLYIHNACHPEYLEVYFIEQGRSRKSILVKKIMKVFSEILSTKSILIL